MIRALIRNPDTGYYTVEELEALNQIAEGYY